MIIVDPTTIICKPNILLIISLLISGCAENISIKENPIGNSIPKSWSSPLPETGNYTGQWWTVFQDSTLTRVFDDFLENSPDLKAIASRLEMSRQIARITAAGSLPSIGIGINGANRKQNLSAFGLSEDFFSGGQGGESDDNDVTSFETENYGLNLSFQWELDLWGRLFNQRRAAIEDLRSTEYDLAYLKFSLQVQIVKAYYQAVESQKQYQLAQETLSSVSELADMVASRYEKGLLSSLDLRLTQSSVSSAKAQLENRHQVYLLVVRNLEALLGKYPDGDYLVNTVLPKNLPAVPPGMPADVIKRRPDVQSALARAQAASYRSAEAVSSFLPGFVLTSSSGTSSSDLSDLLNDDYQVWSGGLNISAPVFQGGRLAANLKMNQASLKLAEIMLMQTIINAFAEIEQALFTEESNKKQLIAFQTSAEQAEAAYSLSRERYDSGLVGLISVLDSQQRWFQARSQVLTAQRAKVNTRLNLILALGGEIQHTS